MPRTDMDEAFLGRGWGFPPQFELGSGAVQMVSAETDIKESLWILFSTRPGERVMEPTYGCPLESMVFEVVDETTLTEIRDAVERSILFFEPRIRLELIDFDTDAIFDGLLKISITYSVRETNTRHNIVYPFYFREGTNVASELR